LKFETAEKFLVVLSTAPSMEEGRRIARELLDRRLVACVNLVPGVESLYRWEGKLEQSAEVLLIMKTAREREPHLQQAIQEIHGYAVPEALSLEVHGGLPLYLNWIGESVGS
jgi:periplasmic divalent cation tolerance protein